MKQPQNIVIFGGGAWGSALAKALSRTQHRITLLCRPGEGLACLQDELIHTTHDISILKQADLLLWVIPAQNIHDGLNTVTPYIPSHIPILLCSKGIVCEEAIIRTSRRSFLGEQLRSALQNPILILSGPNFAHEISQGLPAASILAYEDEDYTKDLAHHLSSPSFYLQPSSDWIGVQVAGALKNVYAIASGIILGMSLGHNAHAAYITWGLQEMTQIGQHMGGSTETFLGLAGLGDFILTNHHLHSRNMSFGYAIGQGASVADSLSSQTSVVEGYHTTHSAYYLSQNIGAKTPLLDGLFGVLYRNDSTSTWIRNIFSHQIFL